MAIKATGKEKLALGSSLIVAVLSSLCCLGPVVAFLGLGSLGLAAFFESLRPYLLVITALLLGAAFYFAYRSDTVCEGGVCHKRGNTVLWIVTVLVVLLAVFPYYSGLFAPKGSPVSTITAKSVTSSDAVQDKKVALNIEGMTCAGCVINVENTLKKHPGVKSVAVTLDPAQAVVVYDPSRVEPVQLIKAINELGYKASLARGEL